MISSAGNSAGTSSTSLAVSVEPSSVSFAPTVSVTPSSAIVMSLMVSLISEPLSGGVSSLPEPDPEQLDTNNAVTKSANVNRRGDVTNKRMVRPG